MTARRTLLAANWKMHAPPDGWNAPASPYRAHAAVDVIVFPTALDIAACVAAKCIVGGQHARAEADGAFTGDIGMALLANAGAAYVICGHSERRHGHGETDDDVALQVVAALAAGLHPIVCIGETAKEEAAKKTHAVLKKQIAAIPTGDVTWAYEPVWAIGTGKTATPEHAQSVHAFIRSLLPSASRDAQRILYGGSANAMNARHLLEQDDIDGLLVGGASLKPEEFGEMLAIAASFQG